MNTVANPHLAKARKEIEDRSVRTVPFVIFLFALLGKPSLAVPSSGVIFLLPNTCNELIADAGPYIGFLEAVAQGVVGSDPTLAKKILRVLALREELLRENDMARGVNPVDALVRRTLCYYREQIEPVAPVQFNDASFVRFMRDSIGQLNSKVEDAVFEVVLQDAEEKELERKLERNRRRADKMRAEAERSAEKSFKRIAKAAQSKVRGK